MNDANRFVFDTNVLISAALRRRSVPRQALDVALAQGVIVLSAATIQELQDVLFRPQFDKYLSEEARLAFTLTLLKDALHVSINEQVKVCRDPKDDKFLEVAVNSDALCIVSGDDDLLVLHPFRQIPIVTPQTFLTNAWC